MIRLLFVLKEISYFAFQDLVSEVCISMVFVLPRLLAVASPFVEEMQYSTWEPNPGNTIKYSNNCYDIWMLN